MTGRFGQVRGWLLVLMAAFAVLQVGCGGGGGGGASAPAAIAAASPPTSAPNGAPVTTSLAPSTATVVIQDPQATQGPTFGTYRFTGRDATGHLQYGPTVMRRAPKMVLTDVPISVTELLMEAINGSAAVQAYCQQLTMTPGGTVTVNDPVSQAPSLIALDISPGDSSLAPGTTQQFTVAGRFSDRSTQDLTGSVSWSAASASVIAVSATEAGLVTATAPGSTQVSATYAGLSAAVTVKVTGVSLEAIAITPPLPSVTRGAALQIGAAGTFSDGSVQDLTSTVVWRSSDDTVAAVNAAGQISGINPGTATITATQGSVSASITVKVTPAVLQAITITPADPTIPRGIARQMAATGVLSDGTTQDLSALVTWSSADNSVATVSNLATARGIASGVGSGTTRLSATLDGVTGYTTVTVTPAVLVSISVTPSGLSLPAGVRDSVRATGTYSDGTTEDLSQTASWQSSDPSVLSVSDEAGERGVIQAIAPGSVSVSATLGAVSGVATVTVTAVTLSRLEVSGPSWAEKGYTVQFHLIGIYSDGSAVDLTSSASWSSTDTTVATVSNASDTKGLVTAVGAGNIGITAVLGGSFQTGYLIVSPAAITAITVTPDDSNNPDSLSVPVGVATQWHATGTFSDGSVQDVTDSVTWTTSNAALASISNAGGSQGVMTSLGAGVLAIQASSGAVSGSLNVRITTATVTSISVAPGAETLHSNQTDSFRAAAIFSDNSVRDVTAMATWTSSSGAVATVSNATDSNGYVSTTGTGAATITASYEGKTGSASLTVSGSTLQSLTITPATTSVPVGTSQQFTSTATYSDGDTQDVTAFATWTSARTYVASVSNVAGSRGEGKCVGVGSATITASYNGKSATAAWTGTDATLQSLHFFTSATYLPGQCETITVTGTYSDGTTKDVTDQLTWTSSDPTVASVGANGFLGTGLPGTTTLTATDPATGISASGTLTVVATLESILLSPTNPSVRALGAVQMTAQGGYSNNEFINSTSRVTWSSSNPAAASVSNATDSRGLVTTYGPGGTTATITATDPTSGLSASTTLTVLPALKSLAIAPASSSLTVGHTQRFTATATYVDGSTADVSQTVTWTVPDTTALIVYQSPPWRNGLATAVGTGTVMITARDPDSHISTSTTVTVSEATSSAPQPDEAVFYTTDYGFGGFGMSSTTGQIEPLPGSPWTIDDGYANVEAATLSATTDGRHLFVGGTNVLASITLDQSTGEPTRISTVSSPMIASTAPDPSGRYLIATGTYGDATVYAIGADGTLTATHAMTPKVDYGRVTAVTAGVGELACFTGEYTNDGSDSGLAAAVFDPGSDPPVFGTLGTPVDRVRSVLASTSINGQTILYALSKDSDAGNSTYHLLELAADGTGALNRFGDSLTLTPPLTPGAVVNVSGTPVLFLGGASQAPYYTLDMNGNLSYNQPPTGAIAGGAGTVRADNTGRLLIGADVQGPYSGQYVGTFDLSHGLPPRPTAQAAAPLFQSDGYGNGLVIVPLEH